MDSQLHNQVEVVRALVDVLQGNDVLVLDPERDRQTLLIQGPAQRGQTDRLLLIQGPAQRGQTDGLLLIQGLAYSGQTDRLSSSALMTCI